MGYIVWVKEPKKNWTPSVEFDDLNEIFDYVIGLSGEYKITKTVEFDIREKDDPRISPTYYYYPYWPYVTWGSGTGITSGTTTLSLRGVGAPASLPDLTITE